MHSGWRAPARLWRRSFAAAALMAIGTTAIGAPASPESSKPPRGDDAKTESLHGRVVWLAEAMMRLHGVESDADAAQANVALETRNGELIPIVKDARGRAFFLDARWRNREMELLVKRYSGSPQAKVIRIRTLKNGKKYDLDYWCDICAIPMFELKECECCQGPIRIRERLVEEGLQDEAAP
jgi:hypothetical protein